MIGERQRDEGVTAHPHRLQHRQAHAGEKPDQVGGQPQPHSVRHRGRQVHQDQPCRRDQRQRAEAQQQQPRPPLPPAQHHQQQVGQQRKHHVEGGFHRQAPHLGQTLMQIPVQVIAGVDLRQREIAEQPDPGVAEIRPGRSEVIDDVGDQHGDDVGRHDASDPVPGVAADRRLRAVRRGRFHPWPEQQETGQHKEDRDADLHPGADQPEIALRCIYRWYMPRGSPTTRRAATARIPVSDATRSGPATCSSPPWAVVSARVIRVRSRRFAPRSRRRALSRPRSGCRLISTPEIRVFSRAFSVSRDNLAGNSTNEKSGPMVMWPKSLRCKPPSLAMAPTIAPGPILCRLPTAMR